MAKEKITLTDKNGPEGKLEDIENQAGVQAVAEGLLGAPMLPIPTVLLSKLQHDHLKASPEEVRKGQAPTTTKAFQSLYTPLPKKVQLTEVQVIVEEPKDWHGMAVTSAAMEAGKVLSPDAPPPVHYIARLPYEDTVGKVALPSYWNTSQYTPYVYNQKDGRLYRDDLMRDLTSGTLRTMVEKRPTIITTSTGLDNASLTSYDERLKQEKELDKQYPGVLFLQAVGNHGKGSDYYFRNSALTMRALLVGAAHKHEAILPSGEKMQAISGNDYSLRGADLAGFIDPKGAEYESPDDKGYKKHRHQGGTSLSAPQVAVCLAGLAQRHLASEKIPDGVAAMEDVELAALLTSKHLLVMRDDSQDHDPKGSSGVSHLVNGYTIGGRHYSREMGAGLIDVDKAGKLLDSWHSKTIVPRAADVIIKADIPADQQPGKDGLYAYRIKIDPKKLGFKTPLFADGVQLDLEKRNYEQGTMSLAAPDGEKVPLQITFNPSKPREYVMSKTSALATKPLDGEYVLYSEKPLKGSIVLTFRKPLQEGHPALSKKPDYKAMERDLHKYMDFSKVPRKELDAMIFARDAAFEKNVKGKDLSLTLFPEKYLEAPLTMLVAEGKTAQAEALLNAGYTGFALHKEKLLELVKSGDAKAIHTLFTGEKTILLHTLTNGLLVKGFATKYPELLEEKDKLGNTPLLNAERRNVETYKVLLEAGADINARNEAGETVFDRAQKAGKLEELKQAVTKINRDRKPPLVVLPTLQDAMLHADFKKSKPETRELDGEDQVSELGSVYCNMLIDKADKGKTVYIPFKGFEFEVYGRFAKSELKDNPQAALLTKEDMARIQSIDMLPPDKNNQKRYVIAYTDSEGHVRRDEFTPNKDFRIAIAEITPHQKEKSHVPNEKGATIKISHECTMEQFIEKHLQQMNQKLKSKQTMRNTLQGIGDSMLAEIDKIGAAFKEAQTAAGIKPADTNLASSLPARPQGPRTV